jgi:GT2 family glycosyltransferase
MQPRVTIGVPVYHGEAFVAEALESIQNQSYREFEAIISMDGPDPVCEEICRQFLGDSRFRLVVQPERLGWVGNINWLMSQARGDFWYFHQQDDLTAPEYLEVLVDHAQRAPQAALVFCDMVPFGRIEGRFEQPPSLLGATAFIRQMAMLHEQLSAFAFRGLTRTEALRRAGPIPNNDCNDFGVDTTWLAAIALSGELHRVPLELYRKRYHTNNTESGWWAWGKETRLEAWPCHCVNMLEQALRVEGTVEESRLLWLAAVERLTSPLTAGAFLPLIELTRAERAVLLDSFIDRAKASALHDIPVLLDASWDAICDWTRGVFYLPANTPVEIVDFGPNPVVRGRSFNTQPDGSSAIWVHVSRRVRLGSRLLLGSAPLDTVIRGMVLTATVPASLTAEAADLPLQVLAPDGQPLSQPVTFLVLDAASDPKST